MNEENRIPINRSRRLPEREELYLDDLNSENEVLKSKLSKIELENENLTKKNEILLEDLKVKYDDFDWSVIWQDEEKSSFPIMQIIVIVVQLITIVIIFMH